MKTIKLLTLLGMLVLSSSTLAKVTMDDVNRDTEKLGQIGGDQAAIQEQMNNEWALYNRPPNELGEKIDWDNMPAGSKCGDYVMSQNKVQVKVLCQGHNPNSSCPSGFSRQNFGYFEAGGGTRKYIWCSKN